MNYTYEKITRFDCLNYGWFTPYNRRLRRQMTIRTTDVSTVTRIWVGAEILPIKAPRETI